MFWAALIPILKAIGIGAAAGAGTAAVTGGDVKKGALMGGAGGGLGGAFGGLMGKGAGAAGAVSGVPVTPVAQSGFSKLLSTAGEAATKGAANTLGTAAISSMLPSTEMTTPSNVPQMPVNNDTMAMLEKLMQQSNTKGLV